MVFGNCVPSLVVENNSSEIIDYLQVDVAVTLEQRPGTHRRIEIGIS